MTIWKRYNLSECCEIISGATPSTSVDAYWDGDVCWATPKDLSDLDGHFISGTPRKLTEAGLSSCAATLLPPNSVLFSSRAPIGHTAINTVPMATNQGFKSLIPRAELLDSKFLLHWLRRNRPFLEGLGVGATFKEVSKAIVSKVEISLPALSEQRRIAAILDKAEALRAKRRKALAQLDRLPQSIFVEMFGDPVKNPKGWDVVELQELVIDGDNINYGVIQPGGDLDEGIPLIRVGDMVNGTISHDALKRISPAIEADYKRSRLVGDELLLSCVGSIGAVALVTEKERGFNIARAVARIRPRRDISQHFLATQLALPSIQTYFRRELRTVSQPTLNIKQINETKVLRPPEDVQQAFDERIAVFERLRRSQNVAYQASNDTFAAIQHRAFQGRL